MRWILALLLCATISPAAAMATALASNVAVEQIGQQGPVMPIATDSGDIAAPSALDTSAAPETMLLQQLGLDEVSSVRQSGGNDWAEVTQTGDHDRSTITQTGANDYASVWQSSAYAQSTITQTGANNVARVRQ